jgi:hypothetical protein
MKSLRDYLEESQHAADNPVAGDTFAINIREECLIESVVIESRDDGVVIAADDRMIQLLESYGYSFEESELTESHFAVGDRVQCRKSGMKGRIVKLDKDHGADDEQYYTVKRDNGQLKKMAPEDMTKLDEQVMSFDNNQQDPDPGEYDDEGDMAKNELYTMIRSARRLIGMLDNNDNMPEWTQKKITKATDYVDTAADYISSQKERGVMEQQEDSPVVRAVLHRILMQHTGLLGQYGPERVMAAVDELADRVNIGPDDEIGSSDVSAYVREVERALSEQGVAEDIQADDGERYRSADDFFGQFEADHFDEERVSPDGMEVRGYIDGVNVMVWRFDSPRKTSGYGIYDDSGLNEAEYQGRKVQLGKKMKGDVKKSKVYVKNPQGNVVKVNFGDPNMKIRKSNPGARKSFRARHNCDNPGPRHKARYWSCRAW